VTTLAVGPLADAGWLERVVADVKVGSSEGGASPSEASHHPERSGSIRSFKPTGHRHQAEIRQELGQGFELHFSVTSVELVRGALVTAHCFLKRAAADRDLWRLYREAYGETPVCTVFHWTLWCGWAEPAEWLREEGVLADNSRFGSNRFILNPTNECAYAYGTALPFFFRLGPERGNERLDFISEPIAAYECGYDRQAGEPALEPLHRAIENAAFWHTPCCMFYHPVCIRQFPAAREAIDEALRYIVDRGIRAVHMGNDEVNFWWRARSKARISDAQGDEAGLEFTAECDWDGGYVVIAPVEGPGVAATVDGEPTGAELCHEYGRWWARIALERGRHDVTLSR